MPNFLSLVQRPHHSVRVKPQSRECHGLKRWIEAARKRLHRNVLAIACGRAASWAKSRQAAGTWRAFLENRHPSARIPTHP
jgi:hypothetical protein